MFGSLPPQAPTADVFNLLTLVADPEASKSRLQELIKLNNELQTTKEEAHKDVVAANAHRLAAAQDLDNLRKEQEAHQKVLQEHLNKIEVDNKLWSQKFSELADKDKLLAEKENKLTTKEQELNIKHKELFDKESNLLKRETAVSSRHELLTQNEVSYASKVKQLKELINDE